MEFWEMLKVFHSEPKAVFEFQGIKIFMHGNGDIVDECEEVLKLDKYTINYTYTRIR